jgi:hypothetical protein
MGITDARICRLRAEVNVRFLSRLADQPAKEQQTARLIACILEDCEVTLKCDLPADTAAQYYEAYALQERFFAKLLPFCTPTGPGNLTPSDKTALAQAADAAEEAYQRLVCLAEKDDVFVARAHFNIGQVQICKMECMMAADKQHSKETQYNCLKAAKHQYQLGLAAEKQQLTFFGPPVQSSSRQLLGFTAFMP